MRAAAQSASTQATSVLQGDATGDGQNEATDTEQKGGTLGWTPKVGRRQSWNQQDLKRAMQMSVMNESQEVGKGRGFSEAEKGKV